MRQFLSLFLILVLCAPTYSQGAESKVKVALAVAQAARERTAAKMALAKAKAVVALAAAKRERETGCMSDVGKALARAKSEGKPLFVWVGMTCEASPEIRREFKNAIHCYAAANNGNSTPRLIVLPVGRESWVFPRDRFDANTPAAIRAFLKAPPQRQSAVPVMRAANC